MQSNGIRYVEQEESYTSLASFLNQNSIPVFVPRSKNHPKFTGTGKGRLYEIRNRIGEGKIVNTNINGSDNIGRQVCPGLFARDNCDIFSHPLNWKHPHMQPVTVSKSKCAAHCGRTPEIGKEPLRDRNIMRVPGDGRFMACVSLDPTGKRENSFFSGLTECLKKWRTLPHRIFP